VADLPSRLSKPTGWSLVHEAHGSRGHVTIIWQNRHGHTMSIAGYVVEITDDEFAVENSHRRVAIPWGEVISVFA
jgi:hypothetical protein